jgi:Arc/MetJ-type ribon-helix-helix transcriptional regulator
MQRTNIYLDDDDRDAIRVIRQAHGLATDSSAVRFAIREAARTIQRRAKQSERLQREKDRPREGQ